MRPRNFRNYKVWQDSINFATAIYQETRSFPSYENLFSKLLTENIEIQKQLTSFAAKVREA